MQVLGSSSDVAARHTTAPLTAFHSPALNFLILSGLVLALCCFPHCPAPFSSIEEDLTEISCPLHEMCSTFNRPHRHQLPDFPQVKTVIITNLAFTLLSMRSVPLRPSTPNLHSSPPATGVPNAGRCLTQYSYLHFITLIPHLAL